MRRPATSSSADLVFVDTNVLIYARATSEPAKNQRAKAWVLALGARGNARINLQVANELTRWLFKRESHRSVADIREEIATLHAWGDAPLREEDVALAWIIRDRLGYQWFDCLLLAAAYNQGCHTFLSEDMAHGATFESVTIVNPFRVSPDDFFQRN